MCHFGILGECEVGLSCVSMRARRMRGEWVFDLIFSFFMAFSPSVVCFSAAFMIWRDSFEKSQEDKHPLSSLQNFNTLIQKGFKGIIKKQRFISTNVYLSHACSITPFRCKCYFPSLHPFFLSQLGHTLLSSPSKPTPTTSKHCPERNTQYKKRYTDR